VGGSAGSAGGGIGSCTDASEGIPSIDIEESELRLIMDAPVERSGMSMYSEPSIRRCCSANPHALECIS